MYRDQYRMASEINIQVRGGIYENYCIPLIIIDRLEVGNEKSQYSE